MEKLKRFILFLSGNKVAYFASWLAIIIHVAISSLIPLVIRFFIDDVIISSPSAGNASADRLFGWLYELINFYGLWMILVVIAVLTAVQGVFMFLQGKLSALAVENSARSLRNRLYNHIMHQPFEFQARTQTGDLIQRCTSDIETIQGFLISHAVEAVSIIAQVVIVAIIMIDLNAFFTLVSVILLPVIMIITIRFFKSMMKIFLAADEAEGELSTTLQESLSGVRVVKAFAAQNLEKEKFEEKNSFHRDQTMRIVNLMANFWSSTDFLSMLQFIIVIMSGTWLAVEGVISTGTLVAFAAYAGMLIWPVRGLGQMMGYLGQAFVSLDRIREILDNPVEDEISGKHKLNIKGDIVLDNVSFSYPGQPPVFNRLSLHIPAGKTTAILGPTGSGKSTLVHLLLRLYDYQAGSIRLDGVELKDINRRYLRQNIALVLQEPFLFSRDLADNIRIGRTDARDEEIFQAAKIASLHDTISRFDKGYQTPVGERGITLSGGQRQRVAIARTLLRSAPVLIFDDSLSAVDSETDAAIRLALDKRRQGTTTLIISHRITTLAQADQILVLDKGEIVQQGSHEQLIEQDGMYRQVWQLQSQIDN
jgi:ATP-binding cassette subfamily B protein